MGDATLWTGSPQGSHHPGKSGGIVIVAVKHNGFNLLREFGRLRE